MDLNEIMEFDHVITVDCDGNVTDGPSWLYAPNLHDEELDSPEWTLLNGFSGQHGYYGPIMHSSEFIGGAMARHILDTPGTYVAIVAHWESDVIEGWAVARFCSHTWVAGMMYVHPEDLAAVAAVHHVECEKCERLAREGQDF